MEFNTLSNIHIIARVEEVDEKINSYPFAFFSFLFDIEISGNTDLAFRYIFSQQNQNPFTVTINYVKNLSVAGNAKWLEKLCLILCHPDYIKQNNQPIVGILSANGLPTNNTFLYHLNAKVKQQGFNDILFADINLSERSETSEISFAVYRKDLLPGEFNRWYLARLTKSQSLLNIFTVFQSYNRIEKLIQLKLEAESKLSDRQPLLYQLIQQLQSKTSEIYQYQSLIGALTENLSSKNTYLDFLLGKFKEGGKVEGVDFNEVMKIKKFYYQEYEVLPLWYKRFGHIIKVMTGKRSFKSLFDDKLKNNL